MQEKRKILVCPLNWGLGHATRMVPVIRRLQQANFNVVIGAYGKSLSYLKSEFNQLQFIDLPSYTVKYSERESQILRMFGLMPKIIIWTIREHIALKKIIVKYEIDIVLSDNRFGLWNKNIKSIFVSHQIKVRFPGLLKYLEFIYKGMLKFVIAKYNECWVPDFAGEHNLSGNLSHSNIKYKNLFYIGPLSRFSKSKDSIEKKCDITFILSGPEPQRTIFEEIILKQLHNCKRKVILVRGTTKKSNLKCSFPVFNLLNTSELNKIILESEMVICRSGYSSIMDLVALEKRAVLVPTPGQTEQEYLSDYLMDQNLLFSMKQIEFNVNVAYENCYGVPSFRQSSQTKSLDERIDNLNK